MRRNDDGLYKVDKFMCFERYTRIASYGIIFGLRRDTPETLHMLLPALYSIVWTLNEPLFHTLS